MNQQEIGKFSIVIPVYNEERCIRKVVDSLISILEKYDYEIIFINDGSSDNSQDVLNEYKGNEKIILLNHATNLGYGAALKNGIKRASTNIIVMVDADGTYPLEKIPEFVWILEKEDIEMVIGARIGNNVKIPMLRRPAKYFINQLANYLTATKIPDLNSGFRVMKKKIVKNFFHILPDGFSFTSTITLALLTNGFSVKSIPIDYFKRTGKSKIRPIRDTLNFIQLVVRTVLYFNPLKVFVPMSAFLFLLGCLLLSYRIFIAKAFGVTTVALFISSFQILAIGMLADLIDKRMRS